jgi:hypothetical protein
MNGNKYTESTARKEVFDILKQCGPLTLSQIEKLRKKHQAIHVVRHLLKNGSIGILPTYPAKFVAGPGEYEPVRNVSPGMRKVLDAIQKHQPCTALDVAEEIGKSREYVTTYLRIARAANLVHRCGETPARGPNKSRAYLWMCGAGENYSRAKFVPKKKTAPTVRRVELSPAIRDPLVEAFFGRAAA